MHPQLQPAVICEACLQPDLSNINFRNTLHGELRRMKKPIFPAGAAKPLAPYSPAVEANGIVFLSGQIALIGDTGQLRTGSIAEETRQVMENLGLLLSAAGLDFSHLVKCTIFMSSMDHYGAVNEVYGSYFKDAPPAREAVAVAGLPRGVNVEISGIAVRG